MMTASAAWMLLLVTAAAAEVPLLEARPRPAPRQDHFALKPPPDVQQLVRARTNYVQLVDSCLAAIGAAGSIALLRAVEKPLHVKLFAPPLVPIAMIVFAGSTPPPARNIFGGTIGPVAAAILLRTCLGDLEMAPYVAALSLFWFKTSSCFLPPAAGFSLMLAEQLPPFHQMASKQGMLTLLPSTIGTSSIYALSFAVSAIRNFVRIRLVMTQILRGNVHSDLKATFMRYDTSGDGMLDPIELKLALRVMTGLDFSLDTCTLLIRKADADGDGFVNFEEFRDIFHQTINNN
ncbi:hypothetical protein AB1Y20_016120 [Prymnesium parvum]|uniref:EF-hand domain-containing protein n=1 Tax=Prymnesium parvum TaxID=97485 RepID=A0AB34K3D1_PRYPA